MSDDISVSIAIEMRKAVRLLKADPDQVLPIGINDGAALYKIFLQLGAKAQLLSIVQSYGWAMPDEWVLEQLQRWNTARQLQ